MLARGKEIGQTWRDRKTSQKRYSARSNAEALTPFDDDFRRGARHVHAIGRVGHRNDGTNSKTGLPNDTGGSLPLAAPRYSERFSAQVTRCRSGKSGQCIDAAEVNSTFRRSSFRSLDRPRRVVTVSCASLYSTVLCWSNFETRVDRLVRNYQIPRSLFGGVVVVISACSSRLPW